MAPAPQEIIEPRGCCVGCEPAPSDDPLPQNRFNAVARRSAPGPHACLHSGSTSLILQDTTAPSERLVTTKRVTATDVRSAKSRVSNWLPLGWKFPAPQLRLI